MDMDVSNFNFGALGASALEGILSRLMENLVEDEVESLDQPHVVLCRSVRTGSISVSGPYPNGMEAIRMVEMETEAERADEDDPPELQFTVTRLFPATVA